MQPRFSPRCHSPSRAMPGVSPQKAFTRAQRVTQEQFDARQPAHALRGACCDFPRAARSSRLRLMLCAALMFGGARRAADVYAASGSTRAAPVAVDYARARAASRADARFRRARLRASASAAAARASFML